MGKQAKTLSEQKQTWEWHCESAARNGGKIVASCKTTEQLVRFIQTFADNPNAEEFRITKFRMNYDPMISAEQMAAIINAPRKNPTMN